jgi:CheY-like chemotaxis protein
VACEACALLQAQPGWPIRIIVEPKATEDEQAELTDTLSGILAGLGGQPAHESAARPRSAAGPAHAGTLAVPLVGDGEVIGLLHVQRAAGTFSECDLRVLAIVGGQLAAYVSMVHAHEELRVRARELDEARRAALVANHAKDEYLAAVSHELKDPVTSTLAWAQVLGAASPTPVAPARAAAAIERNARTLARLIDDIQGLACVASAELRLDLRALEPAGLLQAAIVGPRRFALTASAGLGGDGAPGWLPVDPGELGPVVSSAVASVAQVAPSGEHIAIRLDRSSAAAVRIAVAAPLAVDHDGGRVLDGIHVLLVDDDLDVLEAFQSVLEHGGATVTAVSSAAAALAALDRERPDALLSDLGMPGESGYDLMRQVVARDAALPAAAFTAFGRVADHERALAAGFRMQLAKPIDAAALVAAVAELVRGQPARGAPLVRGARAL